MPHARSTQILLRLIAKYERQRSRLTFVPNTLGLTASADAPAESLFKGLMDEDQKLFQSDTPLFDFSTSDEVSWRDSTGRTRQM